MTQEEIAINRVLSEGDAQRKHSLISGKKLAADIIGAIEKIREINKACISQIRSGGEYYGAIEWLCDNFYLIEREGKQVCRDIAGEKKLTAVILKRKTSYAAFYGATVICNAYGYELDAEKIIDGYKTLTNKLTLRNAEGYMFTSFLKGAIVMKIRFICEDLGELMSRDIDEKKRQKHLKVASEMETAITSLRFLSTYDFSDDFLAISPLEQCLKNDPSGIYPVLDNDSRAYMRRLVEEEAIKRGMEECIVADEAIKEAALSNEQRKRHVGFWITEGKFRKELIKKRKIIYFCALAGSTAALFFSVLLSTQSIILALLILPAIWDGCKTIADLVAAKKWPPAVIMSVDFSLGVPNNCKSLVVISTLLTSKEKAEQFAYNVEEYYLANRDRNILFGLLCDLKVCDEAHTQADEELCMHIKGLIEQLNEKYKCNNFCLFIRRRTYNETLRKFIGWERKRGAICQVISLIKGCSPDFLCEVYPIDEMSDIRYLVTLDADTRPTLGSITKMIGAMAYPLNHPIIDKEKGRVCAGYAIMQPKMGIDLDSASQTPFSRIFGGQGGIDTYSDSISDIYQDLFGEGIFCGKGIIDVDSFFSLLNGTFPKNRVLSHDILEGGVLRCAYLSRVEFCDAVPSGVIAWFVRHNRWIRGDWQNIIWLFPNIKNGEGKKIKNPMSMLSRYKIFDNMRRSLTPVFEFCAILFLALSSVRYPVFAWIILLSCLFASLIVTAYIKKNSGITRTYSNPGGRLKDAAMASIMQFCLLPYNCLVILDAVLRTIYRITISKKNLLVWVTAAQGDTNEKDTIGKYYLAMWPCVISGLFAITAFNSVITGVIIGLLWMLAPLLSKTISTRKDDRQNELSKEDESFLYDCAKMMWDYFNENVGPQNMYLPPDNLQDDPYSPAAPRTSPSNIGLYLISSLCAFCLSIIEKKDFLSIIQRTISTVEKLEKWNGHLYNWYDTKTGQVLTPRYVSTVDSGNFVACLLTLRSALTDIEQTNDIVLRIDAILDRVDFSILYNKKKRLFSIGYNDCTDKMDEGCYDLLASEARLTSYVAVALGQIEPRHWFSLSRPMSKKRGYMGLFSWTGTMFEYFMPELFLPNYKNTLIYESLMYCVSQQKSKVAGFGIPWGISESGFFAFDTSLSYQYKAFGVQRLGLKRGLDYDLVVSPYSSFLTLAVDKNGSVLNLRHLKELGCFGKYGHYEAVDFTAGRVFESEKFRIVKSFMAHHLGMSIIAVCNATKSNIIKKYFFSDPRMRCAAELLKEKVPYGAVLLDSPYNLEVVQKSEPRPVSICYHEISGPNPFMPQFTAIGTGKHQIIINDSGAGFSSCAGRVINRRCFDLDNPGGIFCFLLDNEKNDARSFTYAPLYSGGNYSAVFDGATALFKADFGDFETSMQVTGGAGEMVESRKIRVINTTNKTKDMSVCVYFEPVLAPYLDDAAHRAFCGMFIEVERSADVNAIIIKRRARGKDETDFYCVIIPYGDFYDMEFETSRENAGPFVRSGLFGEFSSKTGHPVDPCIAIRSRVLINGGEECQGGYILSCGEDLPSTLSRACRLAGNDAHNRCCDMSYARLEAEDELLRLNAPDKARLLKILAAFYCPMVRSGLQASASQLNKLSVKELWRLGLSGNLPIILAGQKSEASDFEGIIAIYRFLLLRGIACDLVLLYREDDGYLHRRKDAILEFLRQRCIISAVETSGGIHLFDIQQLAPQDVNLLYAFSDYIEDDENQKDGNYDKICDKNLKAWRGYLQDKSLSDLPNLDQFNGWGGFDGDDYVVTANTLSPYSFVMGNRQAGGIITSKGGGYTFAKNAREYKITRWSNDPIADPPSEMTELVIHNESVDLCSGICRFSTGSALFYGRFKGISYELNDFFAKDFPVRIRRISLKNNTGTQMFFKLRFTARVVCGVHQLRTQKNVVTEFNHLKRIITAKNNADPDFSHITAFVASNAEIVGYTGNFCDILAGDYESLRIGGGLDPCMSITMDINIEPDAQKNITVLIGAFEKECQLEAMRERFLSSEGSAAEQKKVESYFSNLSSGLIVNSGEKKLDILANKWLIYQTLVSRMWCRTSFYQCGGAYGFRDQLQDCIALIYFDPSIARTHIIRCACHQFPQGDVLHWWHPIFECKGKSHRGIRTRHSDSHLWLVYAVCEYIEKTNDRSILSFEAPYCLGDQLSKDETERYFVPELSKDRKSIYLHCIDAIEKSLSFGIHGLCLIGAGDWNDGMNLVGIAGEGESIWLSWFLIMILSRFAPICELFDDAQRAKKYRERAKKLADAIEEHGWDGKWYLRAFYDDGEAIGSKACIECQIDSIAQSFSVFCKGDDEHKKMAIDSAYNHLVDKTSSVVKLFTPPFDKTKKNPGYIKGYPPGVRENGGQYTHAALWLAAAFFEIGNANTGYEIIDLINPMRLGGNIKDAKRYRSEPYCICADVYSGGEYDGRGGWTWYTGSSGWYYRVVIEWMLGIKRREDKLYIQPAIPECINSVTIVYRYMDTSYSIIINGSGNSLLVDGEKKEFIDLINDGKDHTVEFVTG